MKLEAVMLTDVGVVRDHNEDSAHIDPLQRFFVVADGMGGHAAGEVASAMAVETVRTTLEGSTSIIEAFAARSTDNARRALVQLLQSAVLAAHQAVYQRGNREADKAGMGTTLDVLLIAGQEAFVAHVGDSRTYLIRDGKAAQLTTDHTVAEVLVIEGKLTIEEALVSPYRTVLVNAIGVAADVGVEMAHLQLRKGDRLLICSDGLHDYFLAEQEIADNLTTGEARIGLGGMVETAKDRGGHDNITGVVVTVVDLGEAVPLVVETDQTLPVEVPIAAIGWNDDERTENIAPKDLDRWTAPALPGARRADEATRPTAPMSAVQVAGAVDAVEAAAAANLSGTETTDPSIDLSAIDKAIAKRSKEAVSGEGATDPIDGRAVRQALARLTANEDSTEPALDASLVKAALARARASHGGTIGQATPADPTLPPTAADPRSMIGRASTEPPPFDPPADPDGAHGEDDATVDRRATKAGDRQAGDGPAKVSDSAGTDDTSPLPRVDADKVG